MSRFAKLVATVVSTSRRVLLARLRGFGSENDDTAEPIEGADENSPGVEVLNPLGYIARPVVPADLRQCKAEAFVISVMDGDEQIALFIVDKGTSAHPVPVEEGEARVYSPGSPACVIRLRNAGKIEITATSGQDVVVNGSSLKVARESDPVRIGNIKGTAGPYPCIFTFTPVDYHGVPGAPVVGGPTGVDLAGVVSDAVGQDHFKG